MGKALVLGEDYDALTIGEGEWELGSDTQVVGAGSDL